VGETNRLRRRCAADRREPIRPRRQENTGRRMPRSTSWARACPRSSGRSICPAVERGQGRAYDSIATDRSSV